MNGNIRRAKADARSKEFGLLYDELLFQMRTMWPDQVLNFQLLKQLEHLVMRIEADGSPPITLNYRLSGEKQYLISRIGHQLLEIAPWIEFRIPAAFNVSQRVEIFLRKYWEVQGGLIGTYRYRDGRLHSTLIPQQVKWFNTFASGVKTYLEADLVQGSIRSAESSVEKRYKDASAYVDSLFHKAPDLLLISMELHMGPTLARPFGHLPDEMITLPCRGGEKTQPKVVANVQEMFAKGRHKKALSNMVGFMGRWGRSEAKGTFARVVFFLDGAKVADANETAIAIGNEWVKNFSKGMGTFGVTCLSAAEDGDSYLPVRISATDIKRRRALQQSVILYMTKLGLIYQDQRLQVRSHFFRGELPTKKPIRSPRKGSTQ